MCTLPSEFVCHFGDGKAQQEEQMTHTDDMFPLIKSGIAQSVQRLAAGWTVRGSNPGAGKVFRTLPHRLLGPPSLLYTGYRVFTGDKAAWACR